MPIPSVLTLIATLTALSPVGFVPSSESLTPPSSGLSSATLVAQQCLPASQGTSTSSEDPSWAEGTIDLFTIDEADGGHRLPVYALKFSPDGRMIASGSADQTIKLWDLRGGRLLRTLEQRPAQVTAIAFSPDSQRLASGGLDGSVRVWNPGNGELVSQLTGHTDKVETMTFSPDGQFLVTAGGDRQIHIWNSTTGELAKTLESDQWVTSLAFNADGSLLASGGLGKKVVVWDWQEGKPVHSVSGRSSNIYSIAFNPNNQTLAFSPDGVASANASDSGVLTDSRNSVVLVNLEGRILQRLQGHTDYISSLAFSPSGHLLLTGSWDDTIRLWNVNTGAIVRQFQENSRRILSVAFNPDGTMFASGSGDGSIKLFISRD